MKTDTTIKNQWALSSLGYIREYDTHKAICEMQLVDNDKWSDSNPQWAQNAELIVQAVNACKEINPDNPLIVASHLVEFVEMYKKLQTELEHFINATPTGDKRVQLTDLNILALLKLNQITE